MYSLIFSGVFLLFAALAILMGIRKGMKNSWHYCVARIIIVVISAIASALLSSLIVKTGMSITFDSVLAPVLNNYSADMTEMLNSLPATTEAITALACMVISPVVFYIVFLIVRGLLTLLVKPISKLLESFSKNGATDGGAISIICGAVCALLVFCCFLTPLVGTLDVAEDVVSVVANDESADDGSAMGTVVSIVNGAANNAGSVTVKLLGGGLIYDTITGYSVNGHRANLRDEAHFMGEAVNTGMALNNASISNTAKAEEVRELGEAFEDSVIIPTILSEVMSEAAHDWQEGNNFYSISKPGKGSSTEPLIDSLIEIFEGEDFESVKQDVHSILNIFAELVESESFSSMEDDALSLLSDSETVEGVMIQLLDNERLAPMVDGVVDFGVALMIESVDGHTSSDGIYLSFTEELNGASSDEEKADIFDKYGLSPELLASGDISEEMFYEESALVYINDITVGRSEITAPEAEAAMLAKALADIHKTMKDFEGGELDVHLMISDLGPVLDDFAKTETIGPEKTKDILVALLQAEGVHSKIGFTVIEATDTATSIANGSATKSYTEMMRSLSHIVDVIEAAKDGEKDTTEAVKTLINDLTPESATVIQTMVTPDVIKNHGISGESAEPISDLISDTFGNLSTAKENGMSDEEYEKESAAVADTMNILMAASDSGKSTFGEEGSTGLTADAYVNNIMDSSVMSSTVIDAVYGEGETPTLDPMNSGKSLSESESEELLDGLNSKWSALSEEEKADEANQKKFVAVAALLNVSVDITDSGIVMN